ncbi:MAG TPA: hypothetical protein PKH33_05185 [bacterium]|nr:hypothetical protein [bacterium]
MISLNFGGEHKNTVDAKYRLSIPFRFREKLEMRERIEDEKRLDERRRAAEGGTLDDIKEYIEKAIGREIEKASVPATGAEKKKSSAKEEGDEKKSGQRVWMTKGLEPPVKKPLDDKKTKYEVILKQFIWCLPPDVFDRLVTAIDGLPKNEATIELRNHLIRSAHEVELDQGGRALLPQQLRSYAGIGTGEVIMVGDGATFQLWSKKNYEQLVDTRGREEQIFATYTESGISI